MTLNCRCNFQMRLARIFSIQTRKTTLIIGSATSQLPGAAEDGGEQPAESAQAESVAMSELLAIFCNTSFWILITSHKVVAHTKEIRLVVCQRSEESDQILRPPHSTRPPLPFAGLNTIQGRYRIHSIELPLENFKWTVE
ncbi:hypothetical protein BLNAU_13566 [Blattamonas nauphoetae]|uniref:Uncharacterized protein n=1 Tax=Blattamonas nauphoetae TaxID=2049346 RepID=A0ABQ9XIJ6_9EUKA|nr:hypothetical protein BLNAU_13566 [Blattamonas nauphoetae]